MLQFHSVSSLKPTYPLLCLSNLPTFPSHSASLACFGPLSLIVCLVFYTLAASFGLSSLHRPLSHSCLSSMPRPFCLILCSLFRTLCCSRFSHFFHFAAHACLDFHLTLSLWLEWTCFSLPKFSNFL